MKKSENKKIISGGVDKQAVFREKEWYREKIVEMIKNVENLDYLEFIYNMMMAFREKWGI